MDQQHQQSPVDVTPSTPATDPSPVDQPEPEQTADERETVLVPVDPADPDGEQRESVLEPAPPLVDVPCARCGRAPTEVTRTFPVAVNPPLGPDGEEIEPGSSVHLCPHCGAVLAVLERDQLDEEASRLEQDWQQAQAEQWAEANPEQAAEIDASRDDRQTTDPVAPGATGVPSPTGPTPVGEPSTEGGPGWPASE